ILPEQCATPRNLPEWGDWIGRFEPREMGAPPPPSSMIYTSGTTGNPKGVRRQPHTAESAAKLAEMIAIAFGFGAGQDFRTVITGPLYHAAPNLYGLWAAKSGGFCILQPRFDPEELLQLVERFRITHLHMVPTMFVRLLKLPEETKRKYDLSSLEFVVHAAAPCPPEIKRRMIEWWGPVVNEYYGATETGRSSFTRAKTRCASPEPSAARSKGAPCGFTTTRATRSGRTWSAKFTPASKGFPTSPTMAWTKSAASSVATVW